MYFSANYPDILISDMDSNPRISNATGEYSITMCLSKENRYDYDEYEKFLKKAVSNFRSSPTYKH